MPQIAVRPYDTVVPDNDASEMGNVKARTNVGRRRDRNTRQNLDRPSCQLVEESAPPSLQCPLLVRRVPEPVQRSGKDPRLRYQDDRERAPAVPAIGVEEVPPGVGAKQRANVFKTHRAALRRLVHRGVHSLQGSVSPSPRHHNHHSPPPLATILGSDVPHARGSTDRTVPRRSTHLPGAPKPNGNLHLRVGSGTDSSETRADAGRGR